MIFRYLLPSILLLLVFCNRSDPGDIPLRDDLTVEIDGLFKDQEWRNAKRVELTPNNILYLAQTEEYLFLGVQNQENVARYVDVYLEGEAMGMLNLHASMQLGERQLHPGWNDTVPAWNWGNHSGWMANVVEFSTKAESASFLESIKPYQGQEFRISKKKLRDGNAKLRLEVKDFIGEASDIIFPENSTRNTSSQWFDLVLAMPEGAD